MFAKILTFMFFQFIQNALEVAHYVAECFHLFLYLFPVMILDDIEHHHVKPFVVMKTCPAFLREGEFYLS